LNKEVPLDSLVRPLSLQYFDQIVGRESAIGHIDHLLENASFSVDSILTHVPRQEEFSSAKAIDSQLMKRGLRLRSLYPEQASRAPHVIAELTEAKASKFEADSEVRFYRGDTTRTLIIDNKIAVLVANESSSEPPLTLLVTQTDGIVRGLAAMFENIWMRAIPFTTFASGSPYDILPRTEEVLNRILCGQTDEEIATALNVSTKTVQREVDNLKKHFQKPTRYAMIAEAGRRGYL